MLKKTLILTGKSVIIAMVLFYLRLVPSWSAAIAALRAWVDEQASKNIRKMAIGRIIKRTVNGLSASYNRIKYLKILCNNRCKTVKNDV
jgi:hypothetical protein